jgi:hypothetical protein
MPEPTARRCRRIIGLGRRVAELPHAGGASSVTATAHNTMNRIHIGMARQGFDVLLRATRAVVGVLCMPITMP